MSFDWFSVQTVSAETVNDWFAIVPPRDPGAVDRLLAEVRKRTDRTRLVLSDACGPAIGCVLERDPPGATTWTPRMRADLCEARRQQGLAQLATCMAEICTHDKLSYLECTLKGNGNAERAWRAAMVATGFELVAKKCRYTRALVANPHLGTSDLGRELVRVDPADPRVEQLYEATLEDSQDRSTRFEARHGVGLGGTDLVLIVERDGHLTSLCALEHEVGAKRGWIKYVGTVPFARRTGTATALVAAALARLTTAGAEAADCLIDEENHASIALHARLGFVPTGECGDAFYASLAPCADSSAAARSGQPSGEGRALG